MKKPLHRTRHIALSILVAFTALIGSIASPSPAAADGPVIWDTVYTLQASPYFTTLMFDPNGIPHIGFTDGDDNEKLSVMRLTDGEWEPLGTRSFSPGTANHAVFAMNDTGAVYVAFMDFAAGYKLSVMTYDETSDSWNYVGTPGFSPRDNPTHIAITLDGAVPYVAFSDQSAGYRTTVMGYIDGEWQAIGSKGISANSASNHSIAFGNDGRLYASFEELSDGIRQLRVLTYDEETHAWDSIGPDIRGNDHQLIMSPQGEPHIAFQVQHNPWSIQVMRYDLETGIWLKVGGSEPLGGQAYEPFIAFDGQGSLYLVYADHKNYAAGSLTVQRLIDDQWTVVGTEQFAEGSSPGYLSIDFDAADKPYVAFTHWYEPSEQRVTVMTTYPGNPIDDLAATGGDQKADLTFSAPAGAKSVIVQQSADDGATWTDAYITANVHESDTSATVYQLTNGMTYKFRLDVRGGARQGLSNITSATPAVPPRLHHAIPDDSQVMLMFDAPTGAENVVVEWSTDEGATWTEAAVETPITGDAMSAVVTGLTNGQWYQFRLIVTGGARRGTSNVEGAMPSAPVIPGPTPGSPDPSPGTPDPNPGTPDPNPGTPDPNPGTPDPNPGTPDPNPGSPDPNPGTPAAPPVQRIEVIVDNGLGSAEASKTIIERTSGPNGGMRDNVTLEPDRTKEALDKSRLSGQSVIRVVIPDQKDEVEQVDVQLPLGSLDQIRREGRDLELYTDNVRIILPNASLSGLPEDLFFRLVPIKQQEQRTELLNRAVQEPVVTKVSDALDPYVVARPMEIETNMESRRVDLILPLRDVKMPADAAEREAFLQSLAVYIEHSDGERALTRGKVVEYDGNQLGLAFTIEKFSTFTILSWDGENLDELLAPSDTNTGSRKPYINGYKDGSFKPGQGLTRAELAAMLTRLLGGNDRGMQAPVGYDDVRSGHWAGSSIAYVAEHGLMSGEGKNRFLPEQIVTRAQFAAIITRYSAVTASADAGLYPDVASDHWAAAAIGAVQEHKLMAGYPDGTFRPNAHVTRAEAVGVLNALFALTPLEDTTRPTWSDVSAAHWAYEAIETASRP